MTIKSILGRGISSSVRKGFAVSLFLTFTITIAVAQEPPASTQYAKGIVYWDKNNNGLLDKTERGIENVAVSNGKDIVLTDKSGRYSLPAENNCIIFVIKPAHWMTPTDNDNFPKFYYIHNPLGSSTTLKYPGIKPTGPLPGQINFPLYPHKEADKYQMILLGDIQPYSIEQVQYFGKAYIPELQASDADFICTLGDNVDEELQLYPALKDTLSLAGKPVYFLPGNNDLNFDATEDKESNDTYQACFGPRYYAFNWGQWHILMLEDINYRGKGNGYIPGLGKTQIDFILNDLRRLPSSQKVILMMHAPIKDLPKEEKELLFKAMLRFKNIFTVAGHYHTQSNLYLDKKDGWEGENPLHLLIQGTSCGCTWNGLPDEFGIPHAPMYDGTPKGYGVVKLSDSYQVSYKIPNRPVEYQMNIYLPNVLSTADLAKTEVSVNIFTGSEKTKVEMAVDGQKPYIPMVKTLGKDSEFIQQWQFEQKLAPKYFDRGGWFPDCNHLWKAALPANLTPGAHTLEVISSENQVKHHGKTVFWVK